MPGLQIITTKAGRAALVNAEHNGTAPLTIAEIGITAAVFNADADMTALPAEIKRIRTISGEVVAADTMHVTIRDDGSDTYTVRGIGYWLSNGVLLGVYSQPDPILQKSSQSMMLLAADTVFTTISATSLTFGDANFTNPPASTERQGVIELATIRANREKALFSHIFNMARNWGLTTAQNPCAGITGYSEIGRDIYVEDIEYKKVWEASDQPTRDAMDLAYLTGQRPSDTLGYDETDMGLEWDEVRPLIERAFSEVPDVLVKLYPPNGAPEAKIMPNRTEAPKMTDGRAALIMIMDRYLKGLLDPFVSLLEIHKLMYFLQEAGQPLRLKYEAKPFGPFAQNLRQVLIMLDGHYLTGYGDGQDNPTKPIELVRLE